MPPTVEQPGPFPAPPTQPVTPVARTRLVPTIEGLVWLVIGLIILYQGYLRGINLVALLACFLLGLWFLNLLWVLRRVGFKKLQVTRQVKEAAFAGQPFMVELQATNPSEYGQMAFRVIDRGQNHEHHWAIARLRKHETLRESYFVTVPRRGRYEWPALQASTGYPFGLMRRIVEFDPGTPESVVVLPCLGRLQVARLRKMLIQQPQAAESSRRPMIRHLGARTEFHGLREFRSGDSPRWIHWRTSARVGELMVREFEEPPVDNLTVVLDPWLPRPAEELHTKLAQVLKQNRETIETLLALGPPPPADKRRAKEAALAEKAEPYRQPLWALETAISLAATVCWEWCRQPGARLALGIGDGAGTLIVTETGARQSFSLLEALALVNGNTEAFGAGLLEKLGTAPLPTGPVLLITTRATPLTQSLSARLRRPVTAIKVPEPQLADIFQQVLPGTAARTARERVE